MTLYLKYRPQKISDLDLRTVREELTGILGKEEKPHALLFAGPKGTGKTSAARIVAKVVNCQRSGKDSCEPCNKCEMCVGITKGAVPDVVEMDAASNRGIDEIRELREKVRLAPMRAKYKVYIIDEAHMLTAEAANALLKTLEEPPEKTVFILCTTEPEKLPGTVVSRCMTVRFNKPRMGEIVEVLKRVAEAEGLRFEEAELEAMAKAAKGSFRDAIKTLEQVAAGGGIMEETGAEEFIEILRGEGAERGLEFVNGLVEKGVNIRGFIEKCVEALRRELIATLDRNLVPVIEALEVAYERTKTAAVEQLPLEIFVIENSKFAKVRQSKQMESRSKKDEEKEEKMAPRGDGAGKLEEAAARWNDILREVKPKNHSVEALLRSTRPVGWDGKRLEVEVFYKFHMDKLASEKCREIVEGAVGAVLGVPEVRLMLKLGDRKARDQQKEEMSGQVEEDVVKAAEKIFKADAI